MLINLNTGELYQFPFKDLLESIKRCIGDNSLVPYLNKWYDIFEMLENRTAMEYAIFSQRYESFRQHKKQYEYYQYCQSFPEVSSNFFIQFDIENIKKNIRTMRKSVSTPQKIVDIAVFDFEATNTFSLKPIVMCPFISIHSNNIIIDGNHSLMTALKYKFPLVRYIYYTPQINDFVFSIEWAMYVFFNEINSKNPNGINKSTILNDGNFKNQLSNLMN